ncbi:IclR family transcriptional regulator [Aeromicrobium sp. CFBP 8757]|uniref:IclR family transcriptional regulator n=1 Tax=Aeromicrobium sp. CFBP 8757 TaxID=2775288 RepID=UPI001783421F|nr:IclR family transcriptional regulator [Aeromicrobium sp. CFBP 8757]MBD8605411.1 IclR family transcriptional regulator [Aeromicrobium sp. CFBP 8757]
MVSPSKGPDVISRVGVLLRAVGAAEPDGASTTELARAGDLTRPTTHRVLSSLLREGLIDRDEQTGVWHLGPELYLLGASAAARYDISHHARVVISELARESGESAFLTARRGWETVCLLREDGSFPLRSHVLHEGIRFPLGVASAGLVVLAHLPDRDVDRYLDEHDLSRVWGASHRKDALLGRIAKTRDLGYSTNPGLVVEGSWGMGAAVFDRAGSPAWALSLTGVESRFRAARRPELGGLLLDQAHRLTRLIA